MPLITIESERLAEIVNSNLSMIGILKKVAIGEITEVSALVQIKEQLLRQSVELKNYLKAPT